MLINYYLLIYFFLYIIEMHKYFTLNQLYVIYTQ